MDKRVESLKRKLKNREPVMGTHTVLRDGMISELYGEIGFDYVWIDTEHSALDRQGVLSHLMGARASGTCGLVRVPWNDPVLVKPFLDMGADRRRKKRWQPVHSPPEDAGDLAPTGPCATVLPPRRNIVGQTEKGL